MRLGSEELIVYCNYFKVILQFSPSSVLQICYRTISRPLFIAFMWWHSTFTSIVQCQSVYSLSQVANVRCSCHTFVTCIASWPFLPFFFNEPLKLHQKEYRASVRSLSQISSEMLNQALARPLKERTLTELFQSCCFVILAVCFGLLSCRKKNVFQSAVEQVIIKDVSVQAARWCSG